LHEFLDFDPLVFSNVTPMRPRRWASPFLRDDDDEGVYLPEENFTLCDVLTEQAPLFYVYDLGDRWLHRLDLIETLPSEPGWPLVTAIRGEPRCPLEDSGGMKTGTVHSEGRRWVGDPSFEFSKATFWVPFCPLGVTF
jgi:hypothetical protein